MTGANQSFAEQNQWTGFYMITAFAMKELIYPLWNLFLKKTWRKGNKKMFLWKVFLVLPELQRWKCFLRQPCTKCRKQMTRNLWYVLQLIFRNFVAQLSKFAFWVASTFPSILNPNIFRISMKFPNLLRSSELTKS